MRVRLHGKISGRRRLNQLNFDQFSSKFQVSKNKFTFEGHKVTNFFFIMVALENENTPLISNFSSPQDRQLRRKWLVRGGTVGICLGVTIGMAILWSFYGILQILGFSSTGIVTGSWAANEEKWIMEHNNGIIPKDSWFPGTVSLKCKKKSVKSPTFL